MELETLLDLVLATALAGVAWRAVTVAFLFQAVILYIAFGLLLALVWVRLEAPDLALAEAAIGAGITGALLLDAAGQMGSGPGLRARLSTMGSWTITLATGALVAVLVAVVHQLAERPGGLRELVLLRMPESGVDHPVTAVLLNFRGYDTWLEVAVLLVAALGVFVVRRDDALRGPPPDEMSDPVPLGAVALLLPFMLLVGGYLLWRGTHEPGGAFQAGAVIGALGILLVLTGRAPARLHRAQTLWPLLVAGFGAFLLAGLVTVALGRPLLAYPPGWAGPTIVVVETAVTVSIATTLFVLFAGARPARLPPAGSRR